MNTEETTAKCFDGKKIHDELIGRADYLGNPDAFKDIEWKALPGDSNSTTLTVKGSGTPAIATIVGLVTTDRPYLGPQGNFRADRPREPKLEASKYQCTIGSAGEFSKELGNDFKSAMKTLSRLQDGQAVTNSKKWLLTSSSKSSGYDGVRINHMVFKKRTKRYDDTDESDKTANHPVPPDCEDYLRGIVKLYTVSPVPVYDIDNSLVDVSIMEGKLVGAVVEVMFSIQHWVITEKKNDPRPVSDTFNARLLQIRILREAPEPVDVFDGHDLAEGPFIPGAAKRPREEVNESTSGPQNESLAANSSKGKGKESAEGRNKRART